MGSRALPRRPCSNSSRGCTSSNATGARRSTSGANCRPKSSANAPPWPRTTAASSAKRRSPRGDFAAARAQVAAARVHAPDGARAPHAGGAHRGGLRAMKRKALDLYVAALRALAHHAGRHSVPKRTRRCGASAAELDAAAARACRRRTTGAAASPRVSAASSAASRASPGTGAARAAAAGIRCKACNNRGALTRLAAACARAATLLVSLRPESPGPFRQGGHMSLKSNISSPRSRPCCCSRRSCMPSRSTSTPPMPPRSPRR